MAFQRGSRYNRRRVNFSVGGEMADVNENYRDADWGNSDFLGGHPLSQVNFEENENNYDPSR